MFFLFVCSFFFKLAAKFNPHKCQKLKIQMVFAAFASLQVEFGMFYTVIYRKK